MIGVILSSIVFGVTWLQVYLYYTQYSSRDSISLKIFVAVLTALDSLHLALLGHGLYIILVTNFGNYLADSQAPWTLVVQSIIGVVVTTCIQYFYAFRVFRLSQRKNIYAPVVICVISTAEFGFVVGFVAKSFQAGAFAKNGVTVPFGTSALVLEVLCGMLITTSMVYYILQQRTKIKKTGAPGTSHVLNLIMSYVVNSGALNLVFATACLITYVKFPNTLIYAPFFFILVRLYPCSFMTILNSRVHIRSRLRSCGGNTTITITQEQVIRGDPLTTSRLHITSNEDALAMVTMSKQKRSGTVERAVGFDESTAV